MRANYSEDLHMNIFRATEDSMLLLQTVGALCGVLLLQTADEAARASLVTSGEEEYWSFRGLLLGKKFWPGGLSQGRLHGLCFQQMGWDMKNERTESMDAIWCIAPTKPLRWVLDTVTSPLQLRKKGCRQCEWVIRFQFDVFVFGLAYFLFSCNEEVWLLCHSMLGVLAKKLITILSHQEASGHKLGPDWISGHLSKKCHFTSVKKVRAGLKSNWSQTFTLVWSNWTVQSIKTFVENCSKQLGKQLPGTFKCRICSPATTSEKYSRSLTTSGVALLSLPATWAPTQHWLRGPHPTQHKNRESLDMECRTRRNKDPSVANESDCLIVEWVLPSSVNRPTELPTFSPASSATRSAKALAAAIRGTPTAMQHVGTSLQRNRGIVITALPLGICWIFCLNRSTGSWLRRQRPESPASLRLQRLRGVLRPPSEMEASKPPVRWRQKRLFFLLPFFPFLRSCVLQKANHSSSAPGSQWSRLWPGVSVQCRS